MIVHPTIVCPELLDQIQPDQIQPNAIDITIDDVSELIGRTAMQDSKIVTKPVHAPVLPKVGGFFILEQNLTYQFESNLKISIPEGYCGWLIPRSSLNRNGILIRSGLYDSGYKGGIGGMIYTASGPFHVTKGSRVAQFVMAKMEDGHTKGLYNGQYQEKDI